MRFRRSGHTRRVGGDFPWARTLATRDIPDNQSFNLAETFSLETGEENAVAQ